MALVAPVALSVFWPASSGLGAGAGVDCWAGEAGGAWAGEAGGAWAGEAGGDWP